MPPRPAAEPPADRPARQFRPVRARRTFEEIAAQIRAQITAGVCKPGDKLPDAPVLAAQFKVGRSAVREAIRALEMAGVVSLRKGANGGAFIRAGGDPRVVAEGFNDMLRLGGITLDHVTEARLWAEEGVVRAACRRLTEDELAALERNVAEATRCFASGELQGKAALNMEFHTILARASGNPVMSAIVDALMDIVGQIVSRIGPERNDLTLQSRRRLLVHLRARDADAAAAEMADQIRGVHDRYLAVARGEPSAPNAAAGKTVKAKTTFREKR
jgi:DNA-binding FadR family transcriptional regulator